MLRCLLAAFASTALAQGPADDPGLHDASVDDVATEMEVRRDGDENLSPVVGSGDLSTEAFSVPKATVLPEGTFLVRRNGLVLKAPTGEWIFVPTRVEKEAPIPAMAILPSERLGFLDRAADPEGRTAMVLSGQVFFYHGYNYLLLSEPPRVVDLGAADSDARTPDEPAPDDAAPTEEEDTGDPDEVTTPPSDLDPSIDALIGELENRRGIPLARQVQEGESSRALVPEGTMLVRRAARMVRMAGGEWAITLDSGTADAGGEPLVALPSQTLMRLEALASRRGEDMVLEISGRITAHKERNYIIPSLVLVKPPSDLRSLR